ncbi:MAG: methyltransferase domain-containing protein [bacterium]
MSVQAIYRAPLTVQQDFVASQVAIRAFSRRALRELPPAAYQRLLSEIKRPGLNGIITPTNLADLEIEDLSPAQIEQCVRSRDFKAGDVMDLRKLPGANKAAFPVERKALTLLKKLIYTIVLIGVRSGLVKPNLVRFMNQDGEEIVGIVDLPDGVKNPIGVPWVVIPPAFGKTKETTFLIALELKKNGYGVLRYDDTNSNGESTGEIEKTALTKSTNNILAAVDYLAARFGASSVRLVPFSLSTKAAFKAATLDRERIVFVEPVSGPASLQSLLSEVYGEDLVAGHREGRRRGIINILDRMVDLNHFLGEAFAGGFATFEDTLRDMEQLADLPVVWFGGQDDKWIYPDEIRQALETNPGTARREFIQVPDLGHQIKEAGTARKLFADVVRHMKAFDLKVAPDQISLEALIRPSQFEIEAKALIERGRISRRPSRKEIVKGWSKYLTGYDVLGQIPAYVDYMDLLCEIVYGPDPSLYKPGEKVLDVACGTGNFEYSALMKMAFEEQVRGLGAGELVGVDLVTGALFKAEEKIKEPQRKRDDLPATSFEQVNLETGAIPFSHGYFDKAVASLILSYLTDPGKVVEKICNKVKSGGTVVLTSLKPDADITIIFDHFKQTLREQCKTEEEFQEKLAPARDLLYSAMGWIEHGVEEGRYKYFSEKELRAFLEDNGCTDIRIYHSFANQAIIAVGKMPEVAA